MEKKLGTGLEVKLKLPHKLSSPSSKLSKRVGYRAQTQA